MKRLFGIAIAFFAITMVAGEIQAQQFQNGFNFAVGVGAGRGLNFQARRFSPFFLGPRVFVHQRIEEPPYFAKFPPVYYNDIVARNYGTSPFAVPAGIMPVEGIVYEGSSKTIKNGFYNAPKNVPNQPSPGDKKDDAKKKKAPWDKSAKIIVNPYAVPSVVKNK